MEIKLSTLRGTYSVFKVDTADQVSTDMVNGEFCSVTYTAKEISIICESKYALIDITKEWKFLKYTGSLDDGATGVVAGITGPLADAKVSVFVCTSYDSGYFGVSIDDLSLAIYALRGAGIATT